MATKRQVVNEHLTSLLDEQTGCPESLLTAMRYSLMAPGKRLRPLLVLMATEAAGGDSTAALPAACAAEMIHTYSLIHDDLPAMDDDDLRRGLPTCHKKFGEAMAILAGDALLTLAFQVIAEGLPARTAAACCRELARGSGLCGMVGGQVEDLAWEKEETRPDSAAETLVRIHALKTGALFRSCLSMGIYVAQGERPEGPDGESLAALDQFGRCFGLVFQITDDLLDVEGTAEDLGKAVGKDAARGKLTYPGLFGAEDSRRRALELGQQGIAQLEVLQGDTSNLAALMEHVLKRDR